MVVAVTGQVLDCGAEEKFYMESIQLTRMKSKSSGERIKAVNVLDTTVGGLFSGSLKRCCREKSH